MMLNFDTGIVAQSVLPETRAHMERFLFSEAKLLQGRHVSPTDDHTYPWYWWGRMTADYGNVVPGGLLARPVSREEVRDKVASGLATVRFSIVLPELAYSWFGRREEREAWIKEQLNALGIEEMPQAMRFRTNWKQRWMRLNRNQLRTNGLVKLDPRVYQYDNPLNNFFGHPRTMILGSFQ